MSDGFKFNNNLTYALGAGAFALGGAGAFLGVGAGATDSMIVGPEIEDAEPHEEQPDEITDEPPQLEQLETGAHVDTTGAQVDTGVQVDTTGAHVETTGAHGAGRQLRTRTLQLL